MGSIAERIQASPFSSIAEGEEKFDRDINLRMQTMEPRSANYMNLLQTGNQKLDTLLHDRFEIESIRQEQGLFK